MWAENKNAREGLVRSKDMQEAWKSLRICTDIGGDCYPLKRSRVSTKAEKCRESKLSLDNPFCRSCVVTHNVASQEAQHRQFLCRVWITSWLEKCEVVSNWGWQHARRVTWYQKLAEACHPSSAFLGTYGTFSKLTAHYWHSLFILFTIIPISSCSLVVKTTYILHLWCWVVLPMSIHMRRGERPETRLEKWAEVISGTGEGDKRSSLYSG